MAIPDSVLAAIIAGTATLSASFVQLRSALLREAAAGRSSSAARRRNRLQLIILCAIIGAAGVCGFALSQWLTSGELELTRGAADLGDPCLQLALHHALRGTLTRGQPLR